MKILFLSHIVPYPPHGGALQRGYNLIREISKYNEIYLLAFVHPDVLNTDELITKSREELNKYCKQVEYFPLWPKKSIYHRYASLFMGLLSQKPYSVIAHKSASFRRMIKEILATEKIDLIHFDTIALAQFHDQAISIPAVVTHHNIESQLMRRRADKEESLIARLYLIGQTRKISSYEIEECSRFDRNITVSALDEKELQEKIPNIRTSVVPNGVDVEYFVPGKSGHISPALIYTGGMNMFANRDAVMYYLKEIWPHVKAKVPNVKFYAVGQNPPRELFEMSSTDPNIEVTGFVDDIRPYVARSAVYVVPLRVGGGTRLKVVDAMAMGKAIVSTSIGCEGIEVTANENILIADDPLLFSEKTVELLNNPDKCERLGKAARMLVEKKYAWGMIGRQLQQAYEKTLKNAMLESVGL